MQDEAVDTFRAPDAPEGPMFTAAEVRLLSVALLTTAKTAEKVTHECLDNKPPTGSPALAWFDSRTDDRENHAMGIFLSMQYSILSAADHVRALNVLLRGPHLLSTSTVTVTRGGVEAFARAWYLATARDLHEAQKRHLSALDGELRYPQTLGERIYLRDGQPSDAAQARAGYRSEMQRLGLGAPARFAISRIAADFLSAAFQDDSGRITYSTLSSVAHGHRLGVNSFVYTDDSGGVAGLTNTRQIALNVVSTLTLAAITALEQTVQLFGGRSRHRELLEQAVRRIHGALSPLDDSGA